MRVKSRPPIGRTAQIFQNLGLINEGAPETPGGSRVRSLEDLINVYHTTVGVDTLGSTDTASTVTQHE